MNGRCLSKNKANLTEIDISLRNNVHKYKSFLYGFAHEQTLSADIDLELIYDFYFQYYKYINDSNIDMVSDVNLLLKRLAYLKSEQINAILVFDSLFKSNKYIIANNVELIAELNIILKCLKYIKNEKINILLKLEKLNTKKSALIKSFLDMELKYDSSFSFNEHLRADVINLYLAIGSIDIDKVISQFDKLLIEDLDNLTIEDITRVLAPIYGLNVNKKSMLKMISSMDLDYNLNFHFDKSFKADIMQMYSTVGTIDAGRIILEFDNMSIDDLDRLTIEDVTRVIYPIYGLAIVRNTILRLLNNMEANYNIILSANKYFKGNVNNYLTSDIRFISHNKYLRINDIKMHSAIGTIDVGRTISDFNSMLVSDFNNLTIDDITKVVLPIYGLAVVKNTILKILNNMGIDFNAVLSVNKYFKASISNRLVSETNFENKKYIKTNDAKMYSAIGTLDAGRVIAEFDGLFINDVNGLTIDDIARKIEAIYGLNIDNTVALRMLHNMNINNLATFYASKYTKLNSNNRLLANIKNSANKYIDNKNIKTYSAVGKFDAGNVIANLDSKFIGDMEGLTISDITKVAPSTYGLNLANVIKLQSYNTVETIVSFSNSFALVRKTKLIGLNGLYLSDLDGLTIDEFSQTRIG